jgi:hypothetical protein
MNKVNTIFGTTQGYDIKIGNVYETDKPITLFPRSAGKDEFAIKNVLGFKVIELNKAGRRFTLEFFDKDKIVTQTRRVYREYVESMIDALGLTEPTETGADVTPVDTAPAKNKKNKVAKKSAKTTVTTDLEEGDDDTNDTIPVQYEIPNIVTEPLQVQ